MARTRVPSRSLEPAMTQPEPADRVTIVPTAAPLSTGGRSHARNPLPSARTLSFAGLVAVLAAALAWIVFALPDRVQAPTAPRAETEGVPSEAAAQEGGVSAVVVPPYRQLELERAEAKAREALGRLVESQQLLEETMHVDAWGAAEFEAALDRAVEADKLFLTGSYEEALDQYVAAAADLESLRERGETLFSEAIERGRAALAERRTDAASATFEAALAIHPESVAARAGLARTALQPLIVALLREAERARLRGASSEALALLEEARALDPLTTGLDQALAEVRAEIAENAYQGRLSRAFTALENADYDTAQQVFRDVLRQRPDDPVALGGLAQTERERTLARIDRLHADARDQEDAGDWSAALASFDAALRIDPTLQFARDGRMRLRRRVQAVDDMQALLDDPASLSEDTVFQEANALLARARDEVDAGAAYRETVDTFAALLARARIPVQLLLVSDNATEVTVYKVGRLGSFERRALTLRPGRYTIVGSQAGCRDVRKEIVLDAGMPPVTIQCEERL